MPLSPDNPFCRTLAAALLTCFPHSHAPAQSRTPLADPTRPPMLVEPRSAAPVRPDTAAQPRVWPKLQSVQIPAKGPASALVDGQIVHVGQRIGDATLIAIDAQRIVLRTARYEQHISLTPGIAKTPSIVAEPPSKQPVVALAAKRNR